MQQYVEPFISAEIAYRRERITRSFAATRPPPGERRRQRRSVASPVRIVARAIAGH